MATTKAFLITFIIANIAFPTFSTDYTVGDGQGWTLGVDYSAWAKGKSFFIGDRLVFRYSQGAHNVYKVNGTAFQECAIPSTGGLSSGNDVVTLTTPGKKWYACGVGNHCASGMKLVITVGGSLGAAPAPAPAHAPSSAYY